MNAQEARDKVNSTTSELNKSHYDRAQKAIAEAVSQNKYQCAISGFLPDAVIEKLMKVDNFKVHSHHQIKEMETIP